MSDDDTLTEVVVEEAQEHVDVEGLIDGDSIQDQIDPTAVGEAAGARVGETAGRRLGESIGRQIHEALSDIDEETSPREILSNLQRAVADGISQAVAESREGGSALASIADVFENQALRERLTETITGGEDESEADTDDGDDADVDAGESEQEGVDESEREGADEGSPAETDVDENGEPGEEAPAAEIDFDELDVDDVEELRVETLEEFLETISYRELQSIAKEVDVTANLSREEMTEEIVATVSDESAA